MTTTTEPPSDLLTPGEAAALVGVTIKRLGQLANQGRVPHVRTLGGHRRYAKAPLLRMRAAAADAGRFRALADFRKITRGEAIELLMTAGHDLTGREAEMMIGGTR